jgi:hypothetical protein
MQKLNKSMLDNLTDDFVLPIEDCYILRPFGIYFILLILTSLISNSSVIFVYIKNRKDLLKHLNIMTFVSVILSLIETIMGIPVIIITLFSCR